MTARKVGQPKISDHSIICLARNVVKGLFPEMLGESDQGVVVGSELSLSSGKSGTDSLSAANQVPRPSTYLT